MCQELRVIPNWDYMKSLITRIPCNIYTAVLMIYTMHVWSNWWTKMIERAKIDRFGVRTQCKYSSRPDDVIYGLHLRNMAIDRGAFVWRVKIKQIRDLFKVISESDTQLLRRILVEHEPPTFPYCWHPPSWKVSQHSVNENDYVLTIYSTSPY